MKRSTRRNCLHNFPSDAFRRIVFAMAVFSLAMSAAAQNYIPTQPDNSLTPADPIGIPPQPSTAGTYEAVSNTNGGLSFFLPVLSLPQRGGWKLALGYYNTSPSWTVRQDVSVQGGDFPTGAQPPLT